jgi:hypothetical protein
MREELARLKQQDFLSNASRLMDRLWPNRIISAIQGDAAERIRLAHQRTIEEMTGLAALIETVGSGSVLPAPASTPRVEAPLPRVPAVSRSSECAILDSAQRTDFALDNPDEYEDLVRRCGTR